MGDLRNKMRKLDPVEAYRLRMAKR